MRLVNLVPALFLVGCALPPPPPAGDSDGDDGVDAGAGDDGDDVDLGPDAGPRPDSRPPRRTELSHSSSLDVLLGNSIACSNPDDQSTAETSYYRVFDLGAMGISGGFRVDEVEVGVDSADGGNDNAQPLAVRLHRLEGTLSTNNLTQLAQVNLTVPDSVATTITADFNAVSVPAGSTLVVEVRSPDGDNGNDAFYIGSNTAGQTGPSYIRAADCGDQQPRDLADLGFPNMHIVMRALGETTD